MWTYDDLYKTIEYLGNAAHNAGVAIRELTGVLDRSRRCLTHDAVKSSYKLGLKIYPNNARKIDGKPLVRIRAYKKAWRNERRKK